MQMETLVRNLNDDPKVRQFTAALQTVRTSSGTLRHDLVRRYDSLAPTARQVLAIAGMLAGVALVTGTILVRRYGRRAYRGLASCEEKTGPVLPPNGEP